MMLNNPLLFETDRANNEKKNGTIKLFTDNEIKKMRSKTNRNHTDRLQCSSVQWNKLSNHLNKTRNTQNKATFCTTTTNLMSEIYPQKSPIPLPTPLEKPQEGYTEVPAGITHWGYFRKIQGSITLEIKINIPLHNKV